MTQDCSVFPFLMARVGGRGGAKAGDSVGNLALWTMPPNWTDPRATALTKVELSLTNLIGFFFFFKRKIRTLLGIVGRGQKEITST